MSMLKLWLHGLSAAAIGGAATAVATFLVQDSKFDMRQIGKTAVIGAVLTAAGYLKQSPLPAAQIPAALAPPPKGGPRP